MNSRYIIKSAAVLAAAALCCSCADEWDDHYGEAGSEGSGGTLWEAISAHGDLSNFTRVVRECGYDQTLSGSQAYTVFAPSDTRFTAQQADSIINVYAEGRQKKLRTDENPAIRQFLQNHISLYKNPVSTLTNDTVVMMNGKYQTLTSGAVGGEKFLSSNALCSNGVLFTVDGPISYFPNVFEYLGNDPELDSVYTFLSSYNNYEFLPEKSVAGGIVDGQTTYLDSVVVLRNSLLNRIGDINSEDSTYWMLAPVNSEWNRLVPEYENYFVYDNTQTKRDSMQHVNARLAVIGGAVFNRTTNPEPAFRDSAIATVAYSYEFRRLLGTEPYYIYQRPFDAGGIFDGASDVECSNGHVLKTSDFRIGKYETFLQTIKVEAEYTSSQDTILNAEEPLTVRTVSETNPFYGKVSDNGYVDVIPSSTDASANAGVRFKIPEVLSNVEYDVYVVFAPVLATDTLALADDRLPNRFQIGMSYVDLNGKIQSPRTPKPYTTTTDVVDTVLVNSKFSVPACSIGLSEPQVWIQITSMVKANETSKYSRTMHIDCILLVPRGKAGAADVRRNSK